MAKFRQHHQRRRKSHVLFNARTLGLALVLVFLLIKYLFGGGFDWNIFFDPNAEQQEVTADDDYFDGPGDGTNRPAVLRVQDEFLPDGGKGEVVKHYHYALSYSEEHEQAEWVAYELTKASIQIPNVERTGDFRRDNQIRSRSSEREDYKGSGFDRGHLVPAGDMAFSRQAMSETFLMSNISPQRRAFNGGVWRELEENVRNWAYKFRHLYIVSGPIFDPQPDQVIGANQVTVPSAYYKVILDNRTPERKGIAFIIPNEVTDRHLREFALTIDDVEKITRLNFFAKLLSEKDEIALESEMDVALWPIHEGKYQSRIKNWNYR